MNVPADKWMKGSSMSKLRREEMRLYCIWLTTMLLRPVLSSCSTKAAALKMLEIKKSNYENLVACFLFFDNGNHQHRFIISFLPDVAFGSTLHRATPIRQFLGHNDTLSLDRLIDFLDFRLMKRL